MTFIRLGSNYFVRSCSKMNVVTGFGGPPLRWSPGNSMDTGTVTSGKVPRLSEDLQIA